MTDLHPTIAAVTDRITRRSAPRRAAYLDLMQRQREAGTNRGNLSCGNLAHGFAASGEDKPAIRAGAEMNIGIVTAYNDMLSAHQPYGRYPEQIKIFAREAGATAQVAGGVPAMCDGVTQGQAGMDLSLFSRDNIAQGTAIALSHAMFEGALLLGICDKIVPGLLIGALRFGHLPTILIPAGPMPSGLANKEKVRVRQLYAEGKVGRDALLEAEAASYHGAGTCTFYGTANSNQMMMELMGLHIPGSAFVNPGTKLRQELTRAATHRLTEIGWTGDDYRPLARCVDEKAIVNAAIGLLATGGSTNHAIHLPAIARAAGIIIDWQDFDELSRAVPLLARVYPNGAGDVNNFHAAGGIGYVVRELLGAGLLHGDVLTVGGSMADYSGQPVLVDDALHWEAAPETSRDETMLRPVSAPFSSDGGMRLLSGNLGRAIIKTSAVAPNRWTIEAPARLFDDQDQVLAAFKAGELDRDCVVVVRFQGPRANGMPELHKLTPALGVLQDRGYRVALLTDGRMSGASGKVPAVIHLSPEALPGPDGVSGPLACLQDGDMVRVCAVNGEVTALVDPAEWAARSPAIAPPPALGVGRELFALFRHHADEAEKGGSAMLAAMETVV
ncbi:phosphogluconate dehydratase [Sphingopyxis terrae subsp. terrae NBRC 15098]|uniref:Phosphogluconate dehydratase n=1 Tax=Sphingopyxis terrae subsp. terrae NBRC 15098 TaxID=1219058 RepID=A0A142VVA7_9SPHN|nr:MULTISPECIES: phosphogluconate dehydratase [Sphingopyxis]AMU93671.1 phosphogluconate dehydratase [Sphingopyxis terrae subsp. terrae NBRC 15098]QXF13287.1 phosphogluconate dehydratase [Sphingopyxis terrae subsp. terrae]